MRQHSEINNLVGTCFTKLIECLEQNISKKKSIAKYHQTRNKWTEYKIFELKYGNTKLLENTKYSQVNLVLANFVSVFFLTKLALSYIKQTQYS